MTEEIKNQEAETPETPAGPGPGISTEEEKTEETPEGENTDEEKKDEDESSE